MKASTLQARIEKYLTTKKGNIHPKYEKVIEFIKELCAIAHTRRWVRNGESMILSDRSHQYIDALTMLGVDYETGNDAPRGGATGYYIRLTKKGRNQVREFAKKLNTENL